MYQALYRKWRPQTFSDVVGQEHIVDTLKNQIIHNRISHAYLFCGSRGTGKTSTAKIFSRAVNCLNPVDGNPCNECPACLGILNGSNIDVVEIDAASNNKVDDIREIRDEVIYPPADVKYKVYIIDEAHMLTTSAFNALLKTLEEPPAYVIFILATTEFHKIPATILSRCQKFDFKRITYRDTAKQVQQVVEKDGLKVSPEGIKLLAKAADGSIRDALSILDQCVSAGKNEIGFSDIADILGASDPAFVASLSRAIIEQDISAALRMVNEAVYNGTDILKLSDDLAEYFRNLMIAKTTRQPTEVLDLSEEAVAELSQLAQQIPLNRILMVIEVLFSTMSYAKFITNPKIALETAMLKIAAKETDRDLDSILNRLEKLEQGIPVAAPPVQTTSVFVEETSAEEPETAFEEENEEPFFQEESAEVTVFEEGIPLETLMEEQTMAEESETDNAEPTEEAFAQPAEEFSQEPEEALQEEPELLFSMEDEELAESFQSFAAEMQQAYEEEQAEAAAEESDTHEANTDERKADESEWIAAHFAQVIDDATADADFAFRGIMERGVVEASANRISVIFEQDSLCHIAKMSKYDKVLEQAVKRLFQKEIRVEITQRQEEQTAQPEKKESMLDDVIQKIKEDDEIRFHLE